MFESRHQQVISRKHFAKRMAGCVGLSIIVAATALGAGVLGYRHFAGLEWIDALHNAAMILGGMGPVAEMKSDAAKYFSTAYALFSGLVFVGVVALTLAPVFHRVLHRFHVDESDLKS
jgi:FtsH-binding integral membrane protein